MASSAGKTATQRSEHVAQLPSTKQGSKAQPWALIPKPNAHGALVGVGHPTQYFPSNKKGLMRFPALPPLTGRPSTKLRVSGNILPTKKALTCTDSKNPALPEPVEGRREAVEKRFWEELNTHKLALPPLIILRSESFEWHAGRPSTGSGGASVINLIDRYFSRIKNSELTLWR